MARLFDLKETKGTFQVTGVVSGTESQKFYTSKKTKTGKDFRAINFGVEYDSGKNVYLNLTGMPRDNVYFSKRDKDTGKVETKAVPWGNRNKFKESGFGLIGVKTGLQKTTNDEGKTENLKKTLTEYDACADIHEHLADGMSVFVKGNLDYSTYADKDGNINKSIKRVPNQISLCKDVDFEEFAKLDFQDQLKKHMFHQHIVYMGIEKERDTEDKQTGRFVVQAKIITYNDIVDMEYIMTDSHLANLFKKYLKPYYEIEVHGLIEVTHMVQEIEDDDDEMWGTADPLKQVNGSSKTEMIITGADNKNIDRETYDEESIEKAMRAIKNSKTAEQNFSGKSKTSDKDIPWDNDKNDTDEDEDEEDWG